jgi:hypothetical protein
MNDTQTQIERLIELAIVQRTELKQLVEQLPQLREHLNAEVERTIEEVEPQLRAELEDWTTKQTIDQTAKLGAALEAKITELSKALEVSTQARYNAIIAERAKSANLAEQAEAKIAEHAAKLPSAVKEIVSAELSRFPRAGEIDQLRKEFAEPRGLNPRGKWSPDETYNRLDLVAYNGDSYVSNRDGNAERPSRTSAEWTLSAARGAGGGGGGITSLNDVLNAPTSGQIIGSENGQYVPKTLAAGANITITETANTITIIGDEGQISLSDGTAGAPSLHFTSDTDTGVYRPGANTLGISVSGTQIAYFDEDGLTIPNAGVAAGGSFHAANGNANNPSHSFTSDQDTGFFRHATNQIGVSTNGVASLIFTQNAGELLGHTGVSVTFGAGSSGATIALGQGTNGGVTITPKGSGTAVVNGTTIPASKTLVVTTDKLSALAATSSSELAGVISDETGTGSLVFANTPTLVTPNIGAATGTSVNLSSNATVGGTLTVSGAVTGPSHTAPAATNLTLSGGSSGANLVLAQGAGSGAYFNNSMRVGGVAPANSLYGYTSIELGQKGQGLFGGYNDSYWLHGAYYNGGWKYGDVTPPLAISANAGNLIFYMAPSGSPDATLTWSEKMRLTAGNNNLLIGGTTDISGSGGLKVFGTTDANSTISGALQVLGGVGVAKSAWFGGTVYAGSGTSKAYIASDGSNVGYLGTTTGAFPVEIRPNQTTVARFTTTGNLLVGTTTDGGQKLQVISGDSYIARFTDGSTASVNIQKSAIVFANSGISAYAAGNYDASSHTFKIQTVTALTLDSSQNATFAKKIAFTAQATGTTLIDLSSTDDGKILGYGGSTYLKMGGNFRLNAGNEGFLAVAENAIVQVASTYCKLFQPLWLSNAYVAGAPTATGYLVIKDSTGTSYKIPAVAL